MNTRQKKTARGWGAYRAAFIKRFPSHAAPGAAGGATAGALVATCSDQPAHATMALALHSAGAEHTILEAVATPTDKRRFVMPEYLAGRGVPTSSRHGCGQDAPVREAGGTTSSVCSTSCPPYALEQATGGFLSDSLEGA